MSVNLVAEEDLRAALRPFRVDPQTFAAGIHSRIEADRSQRITGSWAGFSPMLRGAAAFLPLSLLGCRGTIAAAKLAPTSAGPVLLGYLAFPAISLFVLLGATILSVLKIRGVRQNGAAPSTPFPQDQVVRQWWREHRWGFGLVFAASLTLAYFGASWLVFCFYIFSFGILLYVITTFAKLGIGNRLSIGSSCLQGLLLLGQMAAFPGAGASDIHFVDQSLVPAVFFGGALATMLLLLMSPIDVAFRTAESRLPTRIRIPGRLIASAVFILIIVPLTARMLSPTLSCPTPLEIKHFVESFDRAPFSSASWNKWEIPASWAVQSKLNPDFSKPRQLLAAEIAGEQNPFILGNAVRVGLLSADQVDQIRNYRLMRSSVVQSSPNLQPQALTSLEQEDWVIRAAALRDDLSTAERDILEQRLHASLQSRPDQEAYVTLVELLRATQLLDVIGRPVNPNQYRAKIHDLLREFHSQDYGGFELAGGFRQFRKSLLEGKNRSKLEAKNSWMQSFLGSGMPGDPVATSHAVELMAIYGVPDGLDLNWVRSFLRPRWSGDPDRKWTNAVTLDRLNRLPDAPQPTWIEDLYYERTLIAAFVLVGLCLFATLSSPMLKTPDAASKS